MVVQLRHMLYVTLVAVGGVIATLLFGQEAVQDAPWFIIAAVALLCFGLYSAVAQIDKLEATRHWRIVVVAITFGVAAKYALIAGAMLLTTEDWRYSVIAMAVAQIDPLSVAALEDDGRMSDTVKTILAMWAAFDDPVTACITPIILAVMAAKIGSPDASEGWQGLLVDLAPFAAVLVLVGGVSLCGRLYPRARTQLRMIAKHEGSQNGLLGTVLASSILGRIPSLAAILGWFARPKWLTEKRLTILTRIALFGATLLFGMVLADGVNLGEGALLGLYTYAAQGVVAWIVVPAASRLLPKEERGHRRLMAREVWHLALGQMSGITAIVIALNLEVFIDGAVATIAMGIVVVNILHFCANWAFDRLESLV